MEHLNQISLSLSLINQNIQLNDNTIEQSLCPEITFNYGDKMKSQAKLQLGNGFPLMISFNDNAANPAPRIATRKDIVRLVKYLQRNEQRTFQYKKSKSCELTYSYHQNYPEFRELNIYSRFTIQLRLDKPTKTVMKAMKERLEPESVLVFDFCSYGQQDNFYCFYHLVKKENVGNHAMPSKIELADLLPLLKDLQKT